MSWGSSTGFLEEVLPVDPVREGIAEGGRLGPKFILPPCQERTEAGKLERSPLLGRWQ